MNPHGTVWCGDQSVHLQLLILFSYIFKFNASTSDDISDEWQHNTQCSWHSSGGANDKMIQKVNLTCDRGHFHWNNPIGGMHIRFLMNFKNNERICLRIRFIPSYKISYRLLDGNKHRLLNVADEFEKCMNFKLDVLIIIEIHKMKIWKQQVAGFRYEILPESQKLLTCEYCKINNIIDAFCNNADFVFEGRYCHQNNRNGCILIDKILRKPLFHHEIVEKRNNQTILKAPFIGCSHKCDSSRRIYIARMEFDTVHIICSPTISHFARISRKRSKNIPCQLL